MMDWWREIKTVGLRDWCWFVLYLKRNEFHHSLNDILKRGTFMKRQRAHNIDLMLTARKETT